MFLSMIVSDAAGGPCAAVFLAALVLAALVPAALFAGVLAPAATAEASSLNQAALDAARQALLEAHGTVEENRINQGLAQVRSMWRAEDGDAEAFQSFVTSSFLPQGKELDLTFERLEFAMERTDGYLLSLARDLRRGVDLEIGPLLPIDRRLGAYNPSAHLRDDLFANKIAFVTLLNFPVTSLDQRLEEGMSWSRRTWAEGRLTDRFQERVPAAVQQAISLASSTADSYINAYNIHMHHLLTEDGRRLFPEGLRLISHWGLRDELKARYPDPEGLEKQRMIARVMDRIVRQEIPASVIDSSLVDWRPESNRVTAASGAKSEISGEREADERYRHWLEVFHSRQLEDPFQPENPSHVDRRFNVDREIPEQRVRALFESLLASPLGGEVASLVSERLGRPLEPCDIWYVGFKPRGAHDEASLDAMTAERYPSAASFAKDLPRILQDLGFSSERAAFLADHVEVEPSRGAGHAFGAARRDDKAHLRTRIAEGGMDYKGYNIAVHELGHNVEQVFSLTTIDHTLLQGVPNTAFTEALAFVFQNRDLELLGLTGEDATATHLNALATFWNAREIAGVALVDMDAWNWLYAHPEATPAEFREAVVNISQSVWNRFFAKDLGGEDQTLLAVYSHMVDGALYTPDYPLGHLIAFQIEDHFQDPKIDFGREFERICQLGTLTPDTWMRKAVGAPLSAEPLIEATAGALDEVQKVSLAATR